jgi:L,D-peptidoglycan transpeptidase YkuD (ErfK/YbiS/YcfS/YnhG family)
VSWDLLVGGDGRASFGATRCRAALGPAGLVADKREGDGGTPIGAWPCRWLYYRPDRLARPPSGLDCRALRPENGWCDAPGDPSYNRPVTLPYSASAEALWRDDEVYDLIVPLGYNDRPVIAGRGSAIFLHIARPLYPATQGCVALGRQELLAFVAQADAQSLVRIG